MKKFRSQFGYFRGVCIPKKRLIDRFFYLTLLLLPLFPLYGQEDFTLRDPLGGIANDSWLTPSDTLNRNRLRLTTGVTAGLYATSGVLLYSAWYKDYDLGPFQTINDWPEWNQMDKAGHAFGAYMYSRYAFAGARWTGMKRPAARLVAFGLANMLQGMIETFDGFSQRWGWSWGDMGFNVGGSLLFTGQDVLWREQRILMKVSNDLRPHPDVPIEGPNGATSNLGEASRYHYGDNFFERYLKDYNAQTIWLSINPRAFYPPSGLPKWLNVAVGYGVEDVYGPYNSIWFDEEGRRFSTRDNRYRQWFLSPDIYFSRIPTKKRWVRFTLGLLDFVKFPAPALEYSQGSLRGRWLMW